MHNFKTGDGLQMSAEGTAAPTCFRLLWKHKLSDRAWIIEVPPPGSGVSHCKNPIVVSLAALEKMVEDAALVVTQIDKIPTWGMSDDDIRARYSRRDGRCPALDAREMRWNWIRGLVENNSSADIFEGKLIPAWVMAKSQEVKKSRAKIYHAINSYYAGGSAENALLYNWSFSGGKGKARDQAKKLGVPNAVARADKTVDKGYFLTKEDKKKLKFAWEKFLPGRSVFKAFVEMTGVFYRTALKIEDGKYVPVLSPPNRRPTIDQFRYWGPRGNPVLRAWVMGIGLKDWMNNYRGISGSAKDGIVAVGQLAFCDTTTNDVHLVSIASRLKAVGTLNRLMIHEAKSELIMGLHCSFDPPSTRTFLIAVANAACSKVAYFARFGITITEDQAPALAVKTYLGDNGEYRSAGAFKALRQFGAIVELAASGRASLKGPIEGLHHVFHTVLDHDLTGTTHGRQRKRGEVNPILEACLTYYEYMHELLIEVLYYNTEQRVDHLWTIEMRLDNVKPTRIEIYRWMVKKGYVVDFTPDVVTLRSHLLPALPAVLTGTGIYLLREDRGDKAEYVKGLRYMAGYLQESGLLENARRNGNTRITVRGVPEEPAQMWLVTDRGLIELECLTDDPLLLQQGTVRDCLAMQDDNKIAGILGRDAFEQRRSDIEVAREAVQDEAGREKKGAIAALPKRPPKADLTGGIDENRRAEKQLIDPRGTPDEVAATAGGASDLPLSAEPERSFHTGADSPARQAMVRYMKTRGAP